jgi:hypothetical protein
MARNNVVRTISTIAATLVAGVAVASPAAHASPGGAASTVDSTSALAGDAQIAGAPFGKRCGAYRDSLQPNAYLKYWHCGSTWIMIEVDMRFESNYPRCVAPWDDVPIEPYLIADNAWYIGACPG